MAVGEVLIRHVSLVCLGTEFCLETSSSCARAHTNKQCTKAAAFRVIGQRAKGNGRAIFQHERNIGPKLSHNEFQLVGGIWRHAKEILVTLG